MDSWSAFHISCFVQAEIAKKNEIKLNKTAHKYVFLKQLAHQHTYKSHHLCLYNTESA